MILGCGVKSPVFTNLAIRDIGDQFIKVNPGSGGCGTSAGVLEDSLLEYSTLAPDTYTNGLDVHFGAGWIVRRNTFRNFRTASGLAGPALLMWNGSKDTLVEGNTFTDNARDISLGLDPTKTAQAPVSNGARTDHAGGIVKGNTVTRRAGLNGVLDVGILLADSPNTRVEGNTVTMAGTYPNAIEYRFPRTTGVVIAGNVVDAAIVARDGATGTVTGPVGGDCGDGIDNDKDGLVDEGCPPAPVEICGDGIDNDKDGLVDEGCPPAPVEICGDGIDNDKDGLVDEGCTEICGDKSTTTRTAWSTKAVTRSRLKSAATASTTTRTAWSTKAARRPPWKSVATASTTTRTVPSTKAATRRWRRRARPASCPRRSRARP